MANDLNLFQAIGRLGRDSEVRYTASGDACANFSIAVGQSWVDKNSGEKKESTEWIRCVAWRKLGEICGEYLKKGTQVYISGQMKTRKYEKDGQDHYATEIIVDRMQMLGSKSDNAGRERSDDAKPAPKTTASPAAGGPKGSFSDMEDDVPFAPIARGIGGHAI